MNRCGRCGKDIADASTQYDISNGDVACEECATPEEKEARHKTAEFLLFGFNVAAFLDNEARCYFCNMILVETDMVIQVTEGPLKMHPDEEQPCIVEGPTTSNLVAHRSCYNIASGR